MQNSSYTQDSPTSPLNTKGFILEKNLYVSVKTLAYKIETLLTSSKSVDNPTLELYNYCETVIKFDKVLYLISHTGSYWT